jgi:tetratricopeptide (TPR) repeat protein
VPDPCNPNDPLSWYSSAMEYTHEQDYANALRCYQKATELNPDFIDAWGRRGMLLVKMGRFDEARACDAKLQELNASISAESHRLQEVTKTAHPTEGNVSRNECPLKTVWIAGVTSAICPGAGQVYNGEGYGKGWLVLASQIIAALIGSFLATPQGHHRILPVAGIISVLPPLAILLPVLVWLLSIIDAVRVAEKNNHRQQVYMHVTSARLLAYCAATYLILGVVYLNFSLIEEYLFRT